jgi:glycosyltransferase involved in cell wall biosynthesis
MTAPAITLTQESDERDSISTQDPLLAPAKCAWPISFCHFTIAHHTLKSRSFHRQCLPLSNAGFNVSFISPAPIDGRHHNIDFIRLTRGKSFAGRIAAYGSLFIKALRQRADVYHFQDPQLLPLAMLLKLISRKAVVYDAYEDFPSMAAQKRSLPRIFRPLAGRTIAGVEWIAATMLDAILTADPLTLRRLARVGRSRKRVFYNFPNLDFFPAPQHEPKQYDLVYRGGLSERAGTFILLEAISLLAAAGRNVKLLLIGYCDNLAAESQLRARTEAFGLRPQVTFLGRIPHERMAQALAQARIGISPLQETRKFHLNIPVKIFEYWASALPVIASDLPPSRVFMRNSNAGVLFPARNPQTLARVIADLLDHPNEAVQMGARGRAIVEQRMNNMAEARKLVALCRSISGHTSQATKKEGHNARISCPK